MLWNHLPLKKMKGMHGKGSAGTVGELIVQLQRGARAVLRWNGSAAAGQASPLEYIGIVISTVYDYTKRGRECLVGTDMRDACVFQGEMV